MHICRKFGKGNQFSRIPIAGCLDGFIDRTRDRSNVRRGGVFDLWMSLEAGRTHHEDEFPRWDHNRLNLLKRGVVNFKPKFRGPRANLRNSFGDKSI